MKTPKKPPLLHKSKSDYKNPIKVEKSSKKKKEERLASLQKTPIPKTDQHTRFFESPLGPFLDNSIGF